SRATFAPSPSWPIQSRSRRTATGEMRSAGAGQRRGEVPRGDPPTPSGRPLPAELNPPGRLRGPHPYLSTIGLVPVFSLRWSLPPTLGCIPKQPDSEKTGPRRDGGRYRPHTVHGLSLDQEDSGPRTTPGKRSSVRHISHARQADGDSALGSSLFARRY
ncbi:hypothetical protein XENOCAPTIV_020656, partial [Xenoophorus captivus]